MNEWLEKMKNDATQRVLRKIVLLFSIEVGIILKGNDAKKCIFHEPVILCDTL